jgi:hypothetical protein
MKFISIDEPKFLKLKKMYLEPSAFSKEQKECDRAQSLHGRNNVTN